MEGCRRRYGSNLTVWADGLRGECIGLAWQPNSAVAGAFSGLSVGTAPDAFLMANAQAQVLPDFVSILCGIKQMAGPLLREIELNPGARLHALSHQ